MGEGDHIDCCWEDFVLVHIVPALYIMLIICYEICKVKSNLWLQCDEFSNGEFVFRIKEWQCHLGKEDLKELT
jgi:hypothetical protein